MQRLILCLLLGLAHSSVFAEPQDNWHYGSTTKPIAGTACETFVAAFGKPSNYKCSLASNIVVTELTKATATTYYFYHPVYGRESNGPITYQGPGPDKCDPPRYTGPDISKPQGQQCTRVDCAEGDSAGSNTVHLGWTMDGTSISQRLFDPLTDTICADQCNAKVDTANPDDGGECTSTVYPGQTAQLVSCSFNFKQSGGSCQVPHDPSDEPAPYSGGTCGGAGQPACPPISTCGGAGQPACYPGNTCGGVGQPACTTGDGSGAGDSAGGGGGNTGGGSTGGGGTEPTCGGEGQPVCAPEGTCGGEGQPACGSGDGSGSAGGPGCGGFNQPQCKIDESGTTDGSGVKGDLKGMEDKHQEGWDAINEFSLGSFGEWLPEFPTAACVNPSVRNPLTGASVSMPICTYVDALRIIASAFISFFFMLGSVRTIAGALKA